MFEGLSVYLCDIKTLSIKTYDIRDLIAEIAFRIMAFSISTEDRLYGRASFEKCKQVLEYQILLLLSDIWWLKF
jgi:hypothetical protein